MNVFYGYSNWMSLFVLNILSLQILQLHMRNAIEQVAILSNLKFWSQFYLYCEQFEFEEMKEIYLKWNWNKVNKGTNRQSLVKLEWVALPHISFPQ